MVFLIILTYFLMVDLEWRTVDPDKLASEKLADLHQHCFQNRAYPGSAG